VQAVDAELEANRLLQRRHRIGLDVNVLLEISSQPCQMAADLAHPPGDGTKLN
jgi:hypothetical protein